MKRAEEEKKISGDMVDVELRVKLIKERRCEESATKRNKSIWVLQLKREQALKVDKMMTLWLKKLITLYAGGSGL
jgi:hypothetical protein